MVNILVTDGLHKLEGGSKAFTTKTSIASSGRGVRNSIKVTSTISSG